VNSRAPLLTINRCRVEWADLTPTDRAKKLARQGVPAIGVQMQVSPDGEFLSRTNHNLAGYWEQPDATAEAAVIGVPHEKWGETVKALVVLAPGTDAAEQEIIDLCRVKIAHYKCPTSVEFGDELARTATGKLQKFKLRARYWEGLEKAVN